MNGKTFTVIYYRNGKFFWKKEWFACNNGIPDLPKFYFFFMMPDSYKRKDAFSCYCYTEGTPILAPILGIMYPIDFELCIERDKLDYYEAFKKRVAEIIKPHE